MYKTSLKCVKINHICINRSQICKHWPQLFKQGTDKCINEIEHNGLKLTLSQPQMYKNQPQMHKLEFSSSQLPVGWTSVCLGFISPRP